MICSPSGVGESGIDLPNVFEEWSFEIRTRSRRADTRFVLDQLTALNQGTQHRRRHEPGTGEIHSPAVAATLRRLDYRGEGWASCDPEQALHRLRRAFSTAS